MIAWRPGRRRARWLAWLSGLAVLALAVSLASTAGSGPAASRASRLAARAAAAAARCTTAHLASRVHVDRLRVDSAALDTSGTFTPPAGGRVSGLPAICAVALTQADPAGHPIHIAVWLPTTWNGRFQGIGGASYSCGIFYAGGKGAWPSLQEAVDSGYAAASTDCGVPLSGQQDGRWALTASRQLDWPLIKDFSSAGIHDMTMAGQAVTRAYYPGKLRYSYFRGCSTGGREGLMEAQRYPDDYNGIVAGAPAINWTRLQPAGMWPVLVMTRMHDTLPRCKEDAFTAAVVKACDARDGVTDGIISDPAGCHWNADQLIGMTTPCGAITRTDATVMNKIWQGPVSTGGKRLWYGLEPGASLAALAGSSPFSVVKGWLGTWLLRDPGWNWSTLSYAQFDRLFAQSVRQFSATIATDNPNLRAFRQHGGKLLIWHGLADDVIFPQGSIQYYQRVEQSIGGAAQTSSFARLFLAPGVQHCASGAGPEPDDPLAAVVRWVEHGQAPASLLASAARLSRPLCAYPQVARYSGHGITGLASNFGCAATFTR